MSYICTRKRAIGLWCNGNTTDSGPVILGSNPGSPTQKDDFSVVFFCATRIRSVGGVSGYLSAGGLLFAVANLCPCPMPIFESELSAGISQSQQSSIAIAPLLGTFSTAATARIGRDKMNKG